MNAPPPKSNHKHHHTYQTIKKIGNGNFGQVFLVQSSLDNLHYVKKRIRLDNSSKQNKERILKQIKVMQKLNHCYIIKYHQSFVEKKDVCIVMQFAQKGDLDQYLQKRKQEGKHLQEQQIIQWFIQLLLALKYLHDKKIIHRDIKPDNIFINAAQELKIGDFGISKLMSETFDMAKTKIGTPFVMAPQIFQGKKYNQKSDIWSLGCVLYKMITLKYPFQCQNMGAFMAKMFSHKVAPPIQEPYSPQLKELVGQMLQRQPQNRPSVHKILELPFLKKYFSKTLQKTINLYDQNYSSQQGLKKSTSINRLFRKRSSSSLSTSITGKSIKNQDYLKIIEYKQNYPMLQQQNKVLKQELSQLQKEKDSLQQKTQFLLQKMNNSTLSKQEMISQFQQHILNYLYP